MGRVFYWRNYMKDLIMLDGTLAYRVKVELCTNFGEIAASLVPKSFRHLMKIEDDSHLLMTSENVLCIVKRIREVPLNTRYAASEDGSFIYPCFTGEMNLSKRWVVPSYLKWFVVNAYMNAELGLMYMFGVDGDQYYRLPLPNIDGSCKMCTGRFSVDIPSLVSRNSVMNEVLQREWNTDLWSADCNRAIDFFRFGMDGEQLDLEPSVSGLTTAVPEIPAEIRKFIVEVL